MSEEEIIKKLKYLVSEYNRTAQLYSDFFIDKKDIESIQGLLDLYNKEKEKNKILELDLEEMTKSNEHKKEHWVHKAVLNSYISKDKIMEILKNKGGSSFIAKADLQELLEEDNK